MKYGKQHTRCTNNSGTNKSKTLRSEFYDLSIYYFEPSYRAYQKIEATLASSAAQIQHATRRALACRRAGAAQPPPRAPLACTAWPVGPIANDRGLSFSLASALSEFTAIVPTIAVRLGIVPMRACLLHAATAVILAVTAGVSSTEAHQAPTPLSFILALSCSSFGLCSVLNLLLAATVLALRAVQVQLQHLANSPA
eukprot:6179280-Pleurochrysis_carterae.AAC.1